MAVNLQTPIDYLKGVGPNRADLLRKELGIHTYQDLINLFPNRYIDRTRYYKISGLQRNNADVQVIGKITGFKEVAQKRGKRLVATFQDESGSMELVWFRGQKWIRENLKLNTSYVAFGKTNWYSGKFSMAHPELELQENHEKNLHSAMQPVYPSTEKLTNKGVTNRAIGKMMQQLFIETGGKFTETLSDNLRSELGLQWSRSKIFQAEDADYVIGSVHFAPEGLPYDGSKEEALELLKLRGSLEAYWDGYFNEMIQMIECFGDMIQIIGHIDLPKLNVDMPESLINFETSAHPLANKFRTLLELIADRNLSLDVNMAGKFKGVGVYPVQSILRRANELHIPVCVGTDTHHVRYYGLNYKESLEYIQEAGYESYVSYSKLIPENRTIFDDHELKVKYTVLNKGIELLNQRLDDTQRRIIPDFSFGGSFSEFVDIYRNATGMGDYNAIRIRKWGKSITVTNETPKNTKTIVNGLFSEHLDKTGVISSLFNTLASEGINVETARLKSNNDGTAVAFLSIDNENGSVDSAIDFIKGTDGALFKELIYKENAPMPNYYSKGVYLLEMDGVRLNLALSKKVILTKHKNAPGVLLILLSALASRNINIKDLRLGKLNDIGYSALAVNGDSNEIKNLLNKLGDQYYEANLIEFHSF